MKLFCIDTCVLIDIANRLYDEENDIISTLDYLVETQKIRLVFPEVIREEWNRNKKKEVIDKLGTVIKETTKKFNELKPYMKTEDSNLLQTHLVNLRSDESKIAKMIDYNISRIEKLFTKPQNIHVNIDDTHLNIAAGLAYKKKKPFANNKNSMADALILISAVDYAQKSDLELYFATLNKKDFSDKNDNDLHADLVELIQNGINGSVGYLNFKMNYTINLASTINKLHPNSVSKDLEISMLESSSVYHQFRDTMDCSKCGGDTYGSWKMSMYGGLTWQFYCPSCRLNFDTGESFD